MSLKEQLLLNFEKLVDQAKSDISEIFPAMPFTVKIKETSRSDWVANIVEVAWFGVAEPLFGLVNLFLNLF
jgi:hypothetical protein